MIDFNIVYKKAYYVNSRKTIGFHEKLYNKNIQCIVIYIFLVYLKAYNINIYGCMITVQF